MQITEKNLKKIQVIGTVALLLAISLPLLTFAGKKQQIFVNAKASAHGDGTAAKPFKSIGAALEKADKNTNVIVLPGYYVENIEIPKDVAVYGASADSVIIKAKNSDKTVVTMQSRTKIDKVTIEGGRIGIEVEENARVSIMESVIKDNDRDGIRIKDGDIDEDHRVNITNNRIRNNGRSGVYAEERRIVLMDNVIESNEKDGIAFANKVSAYLEDNTMKFNGGSGMAIKFDGADIWTKNNLIKGNDREGVEINGYGGWGRVDLKKNKIIDNGRYAVAVINRKEFSRDVWSGLTVQESNYSFNNGKERIKNITILD